MGRRPGAGVVLHQPVESGHHITVDLRVFWPANARDWEVLKALLLAMDDVRAQLAAIRASIEDGRAGTRAGPAVPDDLPTATDNEGNLT